MLRLSWGYFKWLELTDKLCVGHDINGQDIICEAQDVSSMLEIESSHIWVNYKLRKLDVINEI